MTQPQGSQLVGSYFPAAICALNSSPNKSGPHAPEFIGVKCQACHAIDQSTILITSQHPLPVCVPKNGPPFWGGEAREFPLGPVPDRRIEDKEVVKEGALVLLFTIPEQVDRGEWKATRGFSWDEVLWIDKVHGFHPDFMCLSEPNRCWYSVGNTFQLPVV